jgi:leucyl aminopeptidase
MKKPSANFLSPNFPKVEVMDSSPILTSDMNIIAIGFTIIDDRPLFSNKRLAQTLAKIFDITEERFTSLFADSLDKSSKAGDLLELPVTHAHIKKIYFLNLGGHSRDEQRKVGASLARKIKGTSQKVLIGVEEGDIQAFVTALLLASYSWNLKTSESKGPSTFIVLVDSQNQEDQVIRSTTVAQGTWLARDLIHTPSNIKNPAWMAEQVASVVQQINSERAGLTQLSCEVLKGGDLAEFGGLRAVGGSSPDPGPRFIRVTYDGKKSASDLLPHVVIVGKGITYDTGGVSLKRPYDIMAPMKSDMAGAAAAFATLITAARLELPVKISVLMMCAENALSGTSQRPSDVITQYGGKTVEVLDTDAEGRLVLADGLQYAMTHLSPDYLIDIATLTGAATLGLSRHYGALYSRDVKLAENLHQAGDDAGERLWHMPLVDDYAISLKSNVADISHLGEKPHFGGGSITAALFLENFTDGARWVHLDIAGPARSDVDAGENVKGGTGFGVRVLTEWLSRL